MNDKMALIAFLFGWLLHEELWHLFVDTTKTTYEVELILKP